MIKTAITGNWRFAVYLLIAALLVLINYCTLRTEFTQLIVLYSSVFALFALVIRYWEDEYLVTEAKFVGIALRFIILFSLPNLTDDFYRFIWDGQLLLHHQNPYASMPDSVVSQQFFGIRSDVLNMHLYDQLNSKPYFTIYPPLSQCLFAITGWMSNGNMFLQIVLLKFSIFLFEAGSILLLPRILQQLQLPAKNQLLYTLNPLIILELTGNLHFEAIMVFFMLTAIWLLQKNKFTLSAVAFGFAIGAKLWPIMLLPLFFRYIGLKKTIQYCLISGVTALAVLFPMVMQYVNVASSLNLYFQQFEFNGSIYYVLRWLINKDAHFESFSLMRKLLPLATFFGIIILSIRYKRDQFFSAMLIAFSIYCLFATTVHPWYLTPLIMLSVLSNYRYPILWSLLIYFTYITYINPSYPENYWVVFGEYFILIGYTIVENIVIRSNPKRI